MTDNLERALQERLLARSQVSSRDVEALRLYARTLPARRSLWRGPALRWAMSAAAVVLAAVVAIPVITRLPGFGGTASPSPSAPATPMPSAPVVAPPTPPASPVPTPLPTTPSTPGPSGNAVKLQPWSGFDVYVVIDDPEGLVSDAESVQAENTMSVRWFDAIVEPDPSGPSAIRVTWIGFVRDEVVHLAVSRGEGGKLILHFVQHAPPPASDGVGEDRILVLNLTEPIDPSDVEVTFDYPA